MAAVQCINSIRDTGAPVAAELRVSVAAGEIPNLRKRANDVAVDNLAMEEPEKDFLRIQPPREYRASWWIPRAKARGISPFPHDAQEHMRARALL